jgi:hypothetical protein
MKEKTEKRPSRLDPRRIADGANRGFVKLAHTLMCLVTWRTPRSKAPLEKRRSAPDPRFFALLAKRVERILSHVQQAGEEPGDRALQPKLRELFHQDAGRRLAAVRWIRKRRAGRALSTLESVQAIEESVEVRKEIARAVLEIKSYQSNDRGGARCTSF